MVGLAHEHRDPWVRQAGGIADRATSTSTDQAGAHRRTGGLAPLAGS